MQPGHQIGTTQLNTFGVVPHRTLPAALVAVAILAPVLVWGVIDRSLHSTTPLEQGRVVRVTATSPLGAAPDRSVWFLVPSSGWSTDRSRNTASSVILTRGPSAVFFSGVTDVDDVEVLFERRSREVNVSSRTFVVTNKERYTTPTNLRGYWGDLASGNYSGALVVIGAEHTAAVIVIQSPPARLGAEIAEFTELLNTVRVSQ